MKKALVFILLLMLLFSFTTMAFAGEQATDDGIDHQKAIFTLIILIPLTFFSKNKVIFNIQINYSEENFVYLNFIFFM